MSEDSDEEITDLDIETRTWNKLQATMKLFGFREGAVKGKNLSLQEGFNLGYLDGFKLGEYLGISKGVIDCESELEMPVEKSHFKEDLDKASNQPCVTCLREKDSKSHSKDNSFENLEELIKLQQNHSNEIISTLKNTDLKPYFEQG